MRGGEIGNTVETSQDDGHEHRTLAQRGAALLWNDDVAQGGGDDEDTVGEEDVSASKGRTCTREGNEDSKTGQPLFRLEAALEQPNAPLEHGKASE